MPLSEHEQRQLEQIERALYAEDPKFARNVRVADPRKHFRRRVVVALVGCAVGAALIIVGLISKVVYPGAAIGGAGLLILAVSIAFGLVNWRHMHRLRLVSAAAKRKGGVGKARKPARRRRLMEVMEERWNRRRGGM